MKLQFSITPVVMKMNHEIDSDYVVFKRDTRQEGNALRQLERAIQEVLDGK